MLSIDKIKTMLKDRKISVVSKSIGVSKQALYKILSGETNPAYSTLVKLSDYLETKGE